MLGPPLQSEKQIVASYNLSTNKFILLCRFLWVLQATHSIPMKSAPAHIPGDTELIQLWLGLRAWKNFIVAPSWNASNPAAWVICSVGPLLLRGGKRRNVQFVTNLHGRTTTQAPGVLEQGDAICRKEQHTSWKSARVQLSPVIENLTKIK